MCPGNKARARRGLETRLGGAWIGGTYRNEARWGLDRWGLDRWDLGTRLLSSSEHSYTVLPCVLIASSLE